jgi:dephospho-CoA kinase
MVIGITGELCAGKNLVAEILERDGYFVVDEDSVGHEALEACRDRIVAAFGPTILGDSGTISRRALGSIVFGDPGKLRALEEIVHPWMVAETRRRIEARTHPHAAVNAAILHRMGLDALCDRVLLVRAPQIVRFFRCLRRDHLPLRHILRRMASQRTLNRSSKGVDTVTVWNIGSRRSVEKRIRRLVP